MRILHIVTSPDSLRFFCGQLRYMVEHGADVHLLTPPSRELDELVTRECVVPHPVSLARGISPSQDLVAVARVTAALRRARPDIVHAHMSKAGLIGMIASSLVRTPVRIYHNQGMALFAAHGAQRRMLWASEHTSCALATEVLFASPSVAARAVQEGVCPTEKGYVLGAGGFNGVDARGAFDPARFDEPARRRGRASLGIPDGVPVLGFVGRLARAKGTREFVRAWALLRERLTDAHLLAVGRTDERDPIGGGDLGALRRDPRVHLTGQSSDVSAMFSLMDVCVLPSHYEGMPNVALEAAAMEVPVVATRIPGTIDAVVDGATGLLVPPYDVEGLAEAIERYVGDPQLRERHGRAGRARVLRDFRPEAMWAALLAEYERALGVA